MAGKPTLIPVNLPPAPYGVCVHPGLLQFTGEALVAIAHAGRVGVITDSNVAPLHLRTVTDSLRASSFEPIPVILPAGEDHKNLASAALAYDTLLAAKIERASPILALGGGVVGDIAGFVAATILRGVPIVQIPTTLLAMVDASVGGKTGINHPVGKNLIGAFHQPTAVFIDPEVLRTLPISQLQGGLAECIKHDCIRDAAHFANLESEIRQALALDIPSLARLIAHNVAIKARVVEADPFEKDQRAHLNFGHTFGHAIETVSHYQYSHGQCVALGMVAAADLSVRLGMLDEESRRRIVAAIVAAGLPVAGLTLDTDAVVAAMAFDKKIRAGHIRFILLDRIGHAVIRDDVSPDLVRAAVEHLRNA